MVMGSSQIWSPWIIDDIHAKADLGRYRIRGFSSFQKVTHFDDLTFLSTGLTRFPLEGYKERCKHPHRHRRPPCRKPADPGNADIHQRHELRCPVGQCQSGAGQGRSHGRLG